MAIVLSYPSGALADRFGRKLVIVPSAILTGLSFLCFLRADVRLVHGSPASPGASPAASAGPRHRPTPPTSRRPGMNAAAMSTFRMLAETGYVLGPMVLGLVADVLRRQRRARLDVGVAGRRRLFAWRRRVAPPGPRARVGPQDREHEQDAKGVLFILS